MANIRKSLQKLFRLSDDKTLNSDITILSVCIFLIALFGVASMMDSDTAATQSYYKCAGPGFADFGCDGGIDGFIASAIGITLSFIFIAAFLISLNRVVYRINMRKKLKTKI